MHGLWPNAGWKPAPQTTMETNGIESKTPDPFTGSAPKTAPETKGTESKTPDPFTGSDPFIGSGGHLSGVGGGSRCKYSISSDGGSMLNTTGFPVRGWMNSRFTAASSRRGAGAPP